jgi:large subunit ribosomal protein L29
VPSPETVELRARTDEQLRQDLDEAHQALFNLRFQGATHQLADNSQVSKARRRIARIHTLMREREILAELDAELAGEGVAVDDAVVAEAVADEPAASMDDEQDEAAEIENEDASDEAESEDEAEAEERED